MNHQFLRPQNLWTEIRPNSFRSGKREVGVEGVDTLRPHHSVYSTTYRMRTLYGLWIFNLQRENSSTTTVRGKSPGLGQEPPLRRVPYLVTPREKDTDTED